MKTIYSCLFALLISLPTINAQPLSSTHPGSRSPLGVGFNNPFPAIPDRAKELNLQGFKEFQHNPGLQGSPTMYTSKKSKATQSDTTLYLLDSIIYRDRNGINLSRSIFTYDANGHQTLDVKYTWDATNNIWIGSQKAEYTYDANGNRTLNAGYTWDATNNIWKGFYRYESTYDANGHQTLNAYYTWDATNNIWKVAARYEYTYDASGHQTLYVYYKWDTSNNIWITAFKEEDTYDANGQLILRFYYDWDKINNIWIGSGKGENTYDANRHITLSVSYTWDNTNNIWIGSSKGEYTYDANGYRTRYAFYTWDKFNNMWIGSSKGEYTYDANGNIISIYQWVLDGEWILDQISTNFYSMKTITEVANLTSASIRIYPNPAKNEFRINGLKEQSKFTLFDLKGMLLMSKDIINDESISISSLPKGIYLIRLTNHEGSIISKLIKE